MKNLLLLCCSLLLLVTVAIPAAFAATIQLPATGQTACYDTSGAPITCTGTGQDGDKQAGLAWPVPRFTDNGNSTVTDNLTGLIWAKNANLMLTRDPSFDADSTAGDGLVTWQHALDYVVKLNDESYLGYTDWRLPNIRELESIQSMASSNPSLPSGHPFVSVEAFESYWTSTSDLYSPATYAKAFRLYTGHLLTVAKTSDYVVWPVRGSSNLPKTGQTVSYANGDDGYLESGVTWPVTRFTDNANGTVTDNLTGLIWLKNANCYGALDWATALQNAASLKHGLCDLSDSSSEGQWRLANRTELFSLTDYSSTASADKGLTAGHPFLNLQTGYWSSDTDPITFTNAVLVNTGASQTLKYSKTLAKSNWYVRNPQAVSYLLTADLAGDGTGAVTSSPSGINCPGDCSETLTGGTQVILTATPDSGSAFSGWTNCDSTSGNQCTVAVNSAKTVTATFVLLASSHTVSAVMEGTGSGTITSTPEGISCPETCAAPYPDGSTVILAATPDENSIFTSWSGCDSSSGNQCTLATLASARTATANFTRLPDTYPLTVSVSGNGAVSSAPTGINCPDGACSYDFTRGISVNLTATPTPGHLFAGWSGDCGSPTLYCNLSMDAAKTVGAKFYDPNQFSLHLARTGQSVCYDPTGTIISCSESGQDGDKIAGVAWPEPRFNDNGNGTVADNLTGLIWAKDAGTPTVSTCTGGVMNWQNALNYVACLNTQSYLGFSDWRLPSIREIQSLADLQQMNPVLPVGHPFLNVSITQYYWSSTTDYYYGGTYVNVMSMGTADGGVYNTVQESLPVWPVRTGSVNTAPAPVPQTGVTTSYATGDDGDLRPGIALPFPRFLNNNDGTTTDRLTGLVWTINSNCLETLNGIDKSSGPLGWTDALAWVKGLAHGKCGLSDNSTAGTWHLPNRNELYSLVDHSQGGLPTEGSVFSGKILSNESDNIYWTSSTRLNDLTTNKAWGVSFASGSLQVLSKDSQQHYILAVRERVVQLTATVSAGGEITSNPAGITCSNNTCYAGFTSDTVVTLTATPDEGYSFTGWSGGTCSGTSTTCTVTMDAAKTVTATFEVIPVTYQVSVTLAGTGTGTVTSIPAGISCLSGSSTGCSSTFTSGASVSLEASAGVSSVFAGWSGACSGSSSPCSITVNSALNTTATFNLNVADNARIGSTSYGTLANAYAAAVTGNEIKAQAVVFDEGGVLTFGRDVIIKLLGGYDSGFATPGGYTTIDSQLVIGRGTVTVDRIIIR